MANQTCLFAEHLANNATIVEFAGWDMPLHYGSQLQEHLQVRRDAGIFDVSHMAVVDIKGDAAKAYLSNLLANDVGKLKVIFLNLVLVTTKPSIKTKTMLLLPLQ